MSQDSQKIQPLLSVVVPVYNVEKYLRKCIDSIINQSIKPIEIILVDDGSTDNSGSICDEYSNIESIIVLHKANGGLSDARNAGVKLARTQYIGFVDSDDYIEKDMYELLYSNMVKFDADISFCGTYDVYATETRLAYSTTEGLFQTDSKEAVKLVLEGKKASVSAVNKLYKKSLLIKHPFLVGKTSEDAHFIIPYLTEIQKAVFDMSPKYYYVHREGTTTTRPFKKSDLSIVEAYENNRTIVQEKYPDLINLANFRYYWSLFYIIDKMMRTDSYGNEDEYRDTVKRIRSEYWNIINNQYVGNARKIAVSGLMINKKLAHLH